VGNSVTHQYEQPGHYIITLTVLDPVCLGTDTYAAEIDVIASPTPHPEDFLVPNVFSPNGDGKNERFFDVPTVNNGYVKLQVFNRWGQKIYETASAYKPWDGNVRPGDKAPDGVYYYIVDYSFPCSGTTLEGQQKGAVQLLR
jgi:gliding motility-associated-like protein